MKQLSNSAFVSSKEWWGCYQASGDNTFLDLHSSLDDTKAEFDNC